jgi:3-(3-hydroxy-phenyl)propionate hydroxylase
VQGRASSKLIDSYHAERHEAAVTNVQVTNRTARFLRPDDGMERIMRQATLDLAKKHPFARSLVNTGRMAVANPYSRSPITAPDLLQSHSVQNVRFEWADGSAGCLNQLLQWARGLPLLLVWQQTAHAPSLQALKQLAQKNTVRIVLVTCTRAHAASSPVRETVVDSAQQLSAACGFTQAAAWALIRPDSYLAARSSVLQGQLADVQASLTRLRA